MADLKHWAGRIWWLLAVGLLLVAGWGVSADTDPTWSEPRNLSFSGGATDPRMALDSDGTTHLVWRVRGNTLLYARTTLDGWSEPTAFEAPFATAFYNLLPNQPAQIHLPHLVADGSGALHAFWLSSQGVLYHSAVPTGAFAVFGSWGPRVQLATGIVAFDVALGVDNRLHVVYGRSDEPAGLFYRRSNPLRPGESVTWPSPLSLDAGGYFRSLQPEGMQLRIVAETSRVYVVYDLRAEERVWLVQSADNGTTFAPPRLMAERRPDDRAAAVGPREPLVAVQGEELLVVWQAGDAESDCRFQASSSADGGRTWEAASLPSEVVTCPALAQRSGTNRVVSAAFLLTDGEEGFYLLLTTAGGGENRAQFLAWLDNLWSDPQPLPRQWNHPVTYRPFSAGCDAPVWTPEANGAGRLALFMCEAGGEGDIWLTELAVADQRATWFPLPPEPLPWEALPESADWPADLANRAFLATGDEDVALFSSDGRTGAIIAAGWSGGRWSRPAPVLTSPGGRVGALAVASPVAGQQTLVWEDRADGQVYAARVLTAQATGAANWSGIVPLPLPNGSSAIGSPALVADGSGRLWAAVTVPVNEGRGIYVTESADGGQSWSTPVAVFDAASAGWVRVGPPLLALDQGGRLHLLWQRQAADGQGVSLHGSESEDGVTWAAASRVAENNVGDWYAVVAARDGSVHRLWMAPQGGRQGLQHSYLIDRNAGWSRNPAVVVDERPIRALVDPAGPIHLLTLAEGVVTRRVWEGERWQLAERQALWPAGEKGEEAVIAAIDASTLWLALWGANESADPDSVSGGVQLYRHVLDRSEPLSGPAAVSTPAAVELSAGLLPTPTLTPTLTPTPFPDTVVPTAEASAEVPPTAGDPSPGVAQPVLIGLAIIPAVLVTGVTVAVILRRRAQ